MVVVLLIFPLLWIPDLGDFLGEHSWSPMSHPGLVFFLQLFVSSGFVFHPLFPLGSEFYCPRFLFL
jgi:hypothetical protein